MYSLSERGVPKCNSGGGRGTEGGRGRLLKGQGRAKWVVCENKILV